MTSNELKHKAKLQEWSLAIQECRSSGKPVKQWCIENEIKVTTYYRWEREIMRTAGKSRNKPEHDGTAVFAELPMPMEQYRKVSEQEAKLLTPQQYRWLMEGLKVEQPKAHTVINTAGMKAV